MTDDAAKAVREHYIGGSARRRLSLAIERLRADAAQVLYDVRIDRGWSQQTLANLLGVNHSTIVDAEDADWDGDTVGLLCRLRMVL